MTGAVLPLIFFLALCGLGIALAIALPDRKNPLCVAGLGVLASLLVLGMGGTVLLSGMPFRIELWHVPHLGRLVLEMDRLSALFLCITALVYLPVSIFSAEYMKRYLGRYSIRWFGVLYHLLFASIVLVLLAGDVISLLVAWEAMSIVSYFLVSYEHERDENTRAGFLMLAMGEAGTLAAAIALLLLAGTSGALEFTALRAGPAEVSLTLRWAVFLLSFFGFGVKAGLVPVNSWLPRAHPAAPGNVSAVLSGVIVNLGIYGIIRVNGDLLPVTHTGQGIVTLVVGSLSAFIGILYATVENDLKRMLAHSTIENMGIVTAGLGAAFIFSAAGHLALAGVAFIAAFYHTINHSLYKALLFLGAGAVDSSAGGRSMDHLGGLMRRMPWTALYFFVGALSIAALPPFNGFVSEWLTLQVLLRSAELSSTGTKIVFAFCGAGLALTAALAVTCFVKAFAMSFLGTARSQGATKATEVRRSMTVSMAALAVLCLLLGILPTYVIPVLDRAVTPLVRQSVVDELVPPFFLLAGGKGRYSEGFVSEFHDLGAQTGQGVLPGRGLVVLHQGSAKNPVVFAMSTSYGAIVLLLLVGGSFLLFRRLTRARKVTVQPAWDGGLRRLPPEMTYTATGFSNPVRVIFRAIFHASPVEETREAIAEHFRTAIRDSSREVHIVDRSMFLPLVRATQWLAESLGRMHSGRVNVYAAFVLITLLVFLLVYALS
jgi:hydrogenase-4 component B